MNTSLFLFITNKYILLLLVHMNSFMQMVYLLSEDDARPSLAPSTQTMEQQRFLYMMYIMFMIGQYKNIR